MPGFSGSHSGIPVNMNIRDLATGTDRALLDRHNFQLKCNPRFHPTGGDWRSLPTSRGSQKFTCNRFRKAGTGNWYRLGAVSSRSGGRMAANCISSLPLES